MHAGRSDVVSSITGGSEVERLQRRAAMQVFLAAYVELGTIRAAAEAAGIACNTHNAWLAHSRAADAGYDIDGTPYHVLFAEAIGFAADRVEAEIRRRAVEGTVEDVYYQGKVVGTQRKFSDLLIIFLQQSLAARGGDMSWRDQYKVDVEHTGTVQINDTSRERLRDKLILTIERRGIAEKKALPEAPPIEGEILADETKDE
jgi:hypothetical protein